MKQKMERIIGKSKNAESADQLWSIVNNASKPTVSRSKVKNIEILGM